MTHQTAGYNSYADVPTGERADSFGTPLYYTAEIEEVGVSADETGILFVDCREGFAETTLHVELKSVSDGDGIEIVGIACESLHHDVLQPLTGRSLYAAQVYLEKVYGWSKLEDRFWQNASTDKPERVSAWQRTKNLLDEAAAAGVARFQAECYAAANYTGNIEITPAGKAALGRFEVVS